MRCLVMLKGYQSLKYLKEGFEDLQDKGPQLTRPSEALEGRGSNLGSWAKIWKGGFHLFNLSKWLNNKFRDEVSFKKMRM